MTKIIAHRGSSASAPENTLAAFRQAILDKADGIELDVHYSKDGELMVIHDFTVDRTAKDQIGYISSFTKEELQKMDVGSWFNAHYKDEYIPTLREVFELLKNTSLSLNIELKAGSRIYPKIEAMVIQMIKQYHFENRSIISSFDHYALKEVKNIDPSIQTGMLYGSSMYEPWDYIKKLEADAIHPNFMTVDEVLIKGCIEHSTAINTYTVNDEETMKKLIGKVSSIITNYPSTLYSLMEGAKE